MGSMHAAPPPDRPANQGSGRGTGITGHIGIHQTGLGGAVVLCATMAWTLYGNRLHFLMIFKLTGVAVALFLVLLLAWRAWHIGRPHEEGRTSEWVRVWHGGLATLTLVLGGVVSLLPGLFIGDLMAGPAKQWCLDQVPAIERYREEGGAYPDRLEVICDLLDGPRLVRRGEVRWHSDPDRFSFSVPAGGNFSGWIWSSDRADLGWVRIH